MTTTNLLGVIETARGGVYAIQQEPTDGTAENLTVYELGGNSKEIYDILLNERITRIAIQASDGSILTYLEVKQNGAVTHLLYGGERIANGPEAYNIDFHCNIPVDEKTRIQVKTGD